MPISALTAVEVKDGAGAGVLDEVCGHHNFRTGEYGEIAWQADSQTPLWITEDMSMQVKAACLSSASVWRGCCLTTQAQGIYAPLKALSQSRGIASGHLVVDEMHG